MPPVWAACFLRSFGPHPMDGAARMRRTSVLPQAKPWRRRNLLPPSILNFRVPSLAICQAGRAGSTASRQPVVRLSSASADFLPDSKHAARLGGMFFALLRAPSHRWGGANAPYKCFAAGKTLEHAEFTSDEHFKISGPQPGNLPGWARRKCAPKAAPSSQGQPTRLNGGFGLSETALRGRDFQRPTAPEKGWGTRQIRQLAVPEADRTQKCPLSRMVWGTRWSSSSQSETANWRPYSRLSSALPLWPFG